MSAIVFLKGNNLNACEPLYYHWFIIIIIIWDSNRSIPKCLVRILKFNNININQLFIVYIDNFYIDHIVLFLTILSYSFSHRSRYLYIYLMI